jgi:putative large structural protein
MDQVYGQAYFLNSGDVWASEIEYYLGQVKAQWEGSAMTAIYNYVSSITTFDEYNDVNAYKDYAEKALLSQYEEIEHNWELKATIHYLSSRDEFINRINTNIVNESYLERINAQNIVKDQLNRTNGNTQQLTQGIASAAENWNQNFNQSYQQGLNNFADTLSSIQDEYNTLISQIDASEQTFQNNLDSINQYKNVVKTAVQGIVGQFEADLIKPCNSQPCLYKNADGSFTSAGTVLQALVNQLKVIVNDTSIQPDTILSQISTSINTFLNDQTNQAAWNRDDWAAQINTVQNVYPPTNKYGVSSIAGAINSGNSGLGVPGSSVESRCFWNI